MPLSIFDRAKPDPIAQDSLFTFVLIKPTHYDDDGYPIQWFRSALPSNTLACMNSLAEDARRREVLGPGVAIDIETYDETNRRVLPRRIIRDLKRRGGRALIGSWIVGMVLVSNVIWLLVVGTISVVLARIGATPRSIAFVAGLGFLAGCLMAYTISIWSEAFSLFVNVFSNLSGVSILNGLFYVPFAARILTMICALAIPTVFMIVLAVAAGIKERFNALSIAVATAVPLILLTLAYAVSALSTARKEDEMQRSLDLMLKHEGRYYAQILHQPWPGRNP